MNEHPTVAPGTLVMYADLACPWAGLAVARFWRTRERLDLDVQLDVRCFPLELINAEPTPKRNLDRELGAIAAAERDLGWVPWQAEDWTWPGTVLLALEAVQAAKADAVGGLPASGELDRALRRAMYVDSRPIGLHTEILAVARSCPSVDAEALEDALVRGVARASVFEQERDRERYGVQGSPHVYLADGTQMHNPGVTLGSTGGGGKGWIVLREDDTSVWEDLLRRAAT
jgi:predicted DsbA family dithiol-disulfide isomerase